VRAPRLVQVLQHGGDGRGLAVSRRARDEDQAAPRFGDVGEVLGEVQIQEILDLEGDDAQDHADRAALAKDRCAEAGGPGQRVRDVELAEGASEIDGLRPTLEDVLGDLFGVDGTERRDLERSQKLTPRR